MKFTTKLTVERDGDYFSVWSSLHGLICHQLPLPDARRAVAEACGVPESKVAKELGDDWEEYWVE